MHRQPTTGTPWQGAPTREASTASQHALMQRVVKQYLNKKKKSVALSPMTAYLYSKTPHLQNMQLQTTCLEGKAVHDWWREAMSEMGAAWQQRLRWQWGGTSRQHCMRQSRWDVRQCNAAAVSTGIIQTKCHLATVSWWHGRGGSSSTSSGGLGVQAALQCVPVQTDPGIVALRGRSRDLKGQSLKKRYVWLYLVSFLNDLPRLRHAPSIYYGAMLLRAPTKEFVGWGLNFNPNHCVRLTFVTGNRWTILSHCQAARVYKAAFMNCHTICNICNRVQPKLHQLTRYDNQISSVFRVGQDWCCPKRASLSKTCAPCCTVRCWVCRWD